MQVAGFYPSNDVEEIGGIIAIFLLLTGDIWEFLGKNFCFLG
jgi:hypothetical protein